MDLSTPSCPVCGGPTVLRLVHLGPRVGTPYFCCESYPECTGGARVGADAAAAAR